MFKTFSLFAIIAIASANTDEKTGDEKTGDDKTAATTKVVAMTEEEIDDACMKNMDEVCVSIELAGTGATKPLLGIAGDDICGADNAAKMEAECEAITDLIVAGTAEGADEAAKKAMTDGLAGVVERIGATDSKVTAGTWVSGTKEEAVDTTDTDADKKDAEGDEEASALNLVAGSATLLAVSTMMLQ